MQTADDSKIVIVYSTTDGHTRKICQRLKEVAEQQGSQVTLVNIDDEASVNLDAFDKIIVGASIRYGKHNVKVHEFVSKHLTVLDRKPNAFFTVNVVARKPEKNRPDTNPYLKKFLTQTPWQPKSLEVFAGKINYSIYKFTDRIMIRFIMWLTKGPTDPATNIEFTDWGSVEQFGKFIAEMR